MDSKNGVVYRNEKLETIANNVTSYNEHSEVIKNLENVWHKEFIRLLNEESRI